MKEKRQKQLEAFGRLLDIMDDLREKCPWDRKQTMQTLRPLTIEELYELTDAILEQEGIGGYSPTYRFLCQNSK